MIQRRGVTQPRCLGEKSREFAFSRRRPLSPLSFPPAIMKSFVCVLGLRLAGGDNEPEPDTCECLLAYCSVCSARNAVDTLCCSVVTKALLLSEHSFRPSRDAKRALHHHGPFSVCLPPIAPRGAKTNPDDPSSLLSSLFLPRAVTDVNPGLMKGGFFPLRPS